MGLPDEQMTHISIMLLLLLRTLSMFKLVTQTTNTIVDSYTACGYVKT